MLHALQINEVILASDGALHEADASCVCRAPTAGPTYCWAYVRTYVLLGLRTAGPTYVLLSLRTYSWAYVLLGLHTAGLVRGRGTLHQAPSGWLSGWGIWLWKRTSANEVLLFHGTTEATARKIVQHGFDDRLCARHLYGHCTYFATDACKASQYGGAWPEKCIIVTRTTLVHPSNLCQHNF